MSKKTPDSNFVEALGAVLTAWAKYPNIVRAVFYGSREIGDSLRAALAPKPQSNMVAASSDAQQLSSPIDESQEAFADEGQEAFTSAPLWPLMEDQPGGFVNGFFPVYESPYSRRHRGVGMFW
jgi:hypothetical protein